MDKSVDAFRTISEVSEDLDLPQHVLRFWETRFTQIKPMKRGGGRRYYRPIDVDLIKGIRHLLYDRGYTIKGAQRLVKENGVSFVQALGSGDIEAARTIAEQKKAPVTPTAQKSQASLPDNEIVLGRAKAPTTRRFLPFGNNDAEAEEAPSGPKVALSRENHVLLQEVLFDLLECKRLLDQTR